MPSKDIDYFTLSTPVLDRLEEGLKEYFGLRPEYINDVLHDGFIRFNNALPPEKKYHPKDFFKEMALMRQEGGYFVFFLVYDKPTLENLIKQYNLHDAIWCSLVIMTHVYIKLTESLEEVDSCDLNAEEYNTYVKHVRLDMLQ